MATSSQTRLGTAPEEAVKAPCVVAATTNITLSGEQTISSISVVAGNRVLVAGQTDNTENGIYDAKAGAWSRSTDWNAADDVVAGQLVFVPNAMYEAVFTDASYSPGITALLFTQVNDALPNNTTSYELATSIALNSHVSIITGHTIKALYYDSNRVLGSKGNWAFTGTTTAGNAGDGLKSDGFIYDADGRQFEINHTHATFPQFGARGNNSTDDSGAIQAAINSSVYELHGLGLTYKVDTALIRTLAAADFRRKFIGIKLNGSDMAATAVILTLTGTLGSSDTTASAITAGDNTITLTSTAAFSAAEWIRVASADLFVTTGSDVTNGEWIQIREVTNATTLTLERDIYFSYTTTILIYRPILIESLIFEDFEILGGGDADDHKGIEVEYCRDLNICRMYIEQCGNRGLNSQYNVSLKVNGFECNNADDTTGLAYGIVVGHVHGPSQISNIIGRNLRHLVTVGGTDGVSWHTTVTNWTVEGGTDGCLDCHPGAAYTTFGPGTGDCNSSVGDGDGITLQGAWNTVRGCVITGAGRHGILLQPQTDVANDWHSIEAVVKDFARVTSGSSGFRIGFNKDSGNIQRIVIRGEAYSANTNAKGLTIGASTAGVTTDVLDVDLVTETASFGIQSEAATQFTLTRMNIKGSYETTGANNVIEFNLSGSGDITRVNIDALALIGGTNAIRNVSNNVTAIRGVVHEASGQATALTSGAVKVKFPGFEETATGTFTLEPEGVTIIDSSGGAVTGTLGSGWYRGQRKTVVMTDASTASTLTVTNHELVDAISFPFNAVDDTLILEWTDTEWVTVFSSPGSEVVAATNIITTGESGKTFYLNLAGGFVSTLPAPTAGLKFKFIVATAPTGSYTIVTNSSANIIHGQISTSEDAAGSVSTVALADTISFVLNLAIIGDYCEVESDGTSWFVNGMCKVQDGMTTTQAS